jgi:hypothetical protein
MLIYLAAVWFKLYGPQFQKLWSRWCVKHTTAEEIYKSMRISVSTKISTDKVATKWIWVKCGVILDDSDIFSELIVRVITHTWKPSIIMIGGASSRNSVFRSDKATEPSNTFKLLAYSDNWEDVICFCRCGMSSSDRYILLVTTGNLVSWHEYFLIISVIYFHIYQIILWAFLVNTR